MIAAPRIQSIGPPPDKHAERVVSEMINALHVARAMINMKYPQGVFDVRSMGSPEGQRKSAKKFSDAIGPLLLSLQLETAKRGGFKMIATEWLIWDPIQGKAVDKMKLPRDAWLAAESTLYTGKNNQPKASAQIMLVVSYHACVRLAQRADVRTMGDLVIAMRHLWEATEDLTLQHPKGAWLKPPTGHWHVPFATLDGTRAVAIMAPDKANGVRLMVKTVIGPDMTVDDDVELALTATPAPQWSQSPGA